MGEAELSNSAYNIEYYKLYKAEIEREDTVAYHRSISALTFQGFLFASATFLISNPWFNEAAVEIYPFRQFVMALQGGAGFITGLFTAVGVMAAASSINSVSAAYREKIDIDPKWPQLHGNRQQVRLGANFPAFLHFALAILWAIYEIVLLSQFNVERPTVIIIAASLFVVVAITFIVTARYLESSRKMAKAISKDAA